jgi:hypothetical protein
VELYFYIINACIDDQAAVRDVFMPTNKFYSSRHEIACFRVTAKSHVVATHAES